MMYGRYYKFIMLASPIKKIASQSTSCSNLLISTGRFLYQQAQVTMPLPPDDPFEINQGLVERLSACFLCGHPGQLVVAYLPVAS